MLGSRFSALVLTGRELEGPELSARAGVRVLCVRWAVTPLACAGGLSPGGLSERAGARAVLTTGRVCTMPAARGRVWLLAGGVDGLGVGWLRSYSASFGDSGGV